MGGGSGCLAVVVWRRKVLPSRTRVWGGDSEEAVVANIFGWDGIFLCQPKIFLGHTHVLRLASPKKTPFGGLEDFFGH